MAWNAREYRRACPKINENYNENENKKQIGMVMIGPGEKLVPLYSLFCHDKNDDLEPIHENEKVVNEKQKRGAKTQRPIQRVLLVTYAVT